MLKDLQKYIKDKPKLLVFGSNQIFKQIKLDKINEVFVASDCSKEILEKLGRYSKFSNLKIYELPKNKEEITLLCKKEFPVSVVGVIKD